MHVFELRKPECSEKPRRQTTGLVIEATTVLLWGNSSSHCTAMTEMYDSKITEFWIRFFISTPFWLLGYYGMNDLHLQKSDFSETLEKLSKDPLQLFYDALGFNYCVQQNLWVWEV